MTDFHPSQGNKTRSLRSGRTRWHLGVNSISPAGDSVEVCGRKPNLSACLDFRLSTPRQLFTCRGLPWWVVVICKGKKRAMLGLTCSSIRIAHGGFYTFQACHLGGVRIFVENGSNLLYACLYTLRFFRGHGWDLNLLSLITIFTDDWLFAKVRCSHCQLR